MLINAVLGIANAAVVAVVVVVVGDLRCVVFVFTVKLRTIFEEFIIILFTVSA